MIKLFLLFAVISSNSFSQSQETNSIREMSELLEKKSNAEVQLKILKTARESILEEEAEQSEKVNKTQAVLFEEQNKDPNSEATKKLKDDLQKEREKLFKIRSTRSLNESLTENFQKKRDDAVKRQNEIKDNLSKNNEQAVDSSTCSFSENVPRKVVSASGCNFKNGKLCLGVVTCRTLRGVLARRQVVCSEENCGDESAPDCVKEDFKIENFQPSKGKTNSDSNRSSVQQQ